MRWTSQCAVVIPCLNEAQAIAGVVSGAKQYLDTVIVIDDGSNDNTAVIAQAAGAHVVVHPRSQGKGAALRTGWGEARRLGFPWALCMDGDGQHAPEDMPAFLARAAQGDVEMVCGNRMSNATSMPIVRRWTNRFMSWRLSRLVGTPLLDTQCGYRLVNLTAIHDLSASANCFEIESELLVTFATAHRRIAFVPIRVIYANERSKISPMRDAIRWYRWLRQTERKLGASSV
jgi:glycosyltransferase involved in cell wall biosynthesis